MKTHVHKMQEVASKSSGCRCESAHTTTSGDATHSVHFNRLERARKRAEAALDRVCKAAPLVQETRAHMLNDGFCIGACAWSDHRVIASVSGVMNRVPYDFTVSYDLAFMFEQPEEKVAEDERDVLWVDLEFSGPVKQALRIPFRALGVIRGEEGGQVLKIADFEYASDLVADIGDVLATIACILGCVGLVCYVACAPACVTVVACAACLVACVGANVPSFLACLTACGIAVEGLT